MSQLGEPKADLDLRWVAGIVLVMLGSVAYLAYGPGFETAYAGFGALLAIPFCIGALVTGFYKQYSVLGCLATPILLMAIAGLMVLIGAEGFVCLAMLMPFWIAGGLGGGAMTLILARWWSTRRRRRSGRCSSPFPVSAMTRAFARLLMTGWTFPVQAMRGCSAATASSFAWRAGAMTFASKNRLPNLSPIERSAGVSHSLTIPCSATLTATFRPMDRCCELKRGDTTLPNYPTAGHV